MILPFHEHSQSQVNHGIAAGEPPGLRQDFQRLAGKRHCLAALVGQIITDAVQHPDLGLHDPGGDHFKTGQGWTAFRSLILRLDSIKQGLDPGGQGMHHWQPQGEMRHPGLHQQQPGTGGDKLF